MHGRIGAEDVKSVRIETYQAALDLCDHAMPTSVYEAKFSLQHCVAAALSDGFVTLDSFDAAARKRLASLMERTDVESTAEYNAAYPDKWGACLSVEMKSGETLVNDRTVCKGDPESPVTPNEMRAKAEMLFDYARLPAARAQALIDAVLALPDAAASLPEIEDLYR